MSFLNLKYSFHCQIKSSGLQPKSSASLSSFFKQGSLFPVSQAETDDCVTPISSARSFCVKPAFFLYSFIFVIFLTSLRVVSQFKVQPPRPCQAPPPPNPATYEVYPRDGISLCNRKRVSADYVVAESATGADQVAAVMLAAVELYFHGLSPFLFCVLFCEPSQIPGGIVSCYVSNQDVHNTGFIQLFGFRGAYNLTLCGTFRQFQSLPP